MTQTGRSSICMIALGVLIGGTAFRAQSTTAPPVAPLSAFIGAWGRLDADSAKPDPKETVTVSSASIRWSNAYVSSSPNVILARDVRKIDNNVLAFAVHDSFDHGFVQFTSGSRLLPAEPVPVTMRLDGTVLVLSIGAAKLKTPMGTMWAPTEELRFAKFATPVPGKAVPPKKW